MKNIKIKDVAKAAGVSVTTVSRALNNYSDISEKTKEKIRKIANDMNYAPNNNARILGGKHTNIIALLTADLKEKDENGFVFGLISGAYSICEKNDAEFMLLATNSEKQQKLNFKQLCKQKDLSGVIVAGLELNDIYYEQICDSDIPCVTVDMQIPGKNTCSISIDNERAAREVINYLINNGHKNIAIINGIRETLVSEKRLLGYKKALEINKLEYNPKYNVYANFDKKLAYEKTKKLIENNKEITALFCTSDIMAIEAIRAINDLGLSVPQDISVVGFDDILISQYINGGITTIHQSPRIVGQRACEWIFDCLSTNKVKTHSINLEFELIERKTVKNIS